MCTPAHSLWLPGYMDVAQTVLTRLTMAGLFPDRPRIPTEELCITSWGILSSFIVCDGKKRVLDPDLQICTAVAVRLFLEPGLYGCWQRCRGHCYLTISSWWSQCFCSSPFPRLSKCSPFEHGPTVCLKGQGEEKQKCRQRHETAVSKKGAPTRTSWHRKESIYILFKRQRVGVSDGWKGDDVAQADLLYCLRKGSSGLVKMIPFGNEETECWNTRFLLLLSKQP